MAHLFSILERERAEGCCVEHRCSFRAPMCTEAWGIAAALLCAWVAWVGAAAFITCHLLAVGRCASHARAVNCLVRRQGRASASCALAGMFLMAYWPDNQAGSQVVVGHGAHPSLRSVCCLLPALWSLAPFPLEC